MQSICQPIADSNNLCNQITITISANLCFGFNNFGTKLTLFGVPGILSAFNN